MTLVYECVNKQDSVNVSENNDNEPLSTNIERMRKKILKLVNEDKEKALISNVVRYLLEYDNEDNNESTNDSQTDLSIDELRKKNKELSDKMDAELIEYMKKELKSLKLCEISEFIITEANESEKDYNIDIMNMKSNTAYIIPSVNLNTIKFCSFIGEISELFDKIYVIKCFVDDSYTERVVILTGTRNEQQTVNSSNIIHQEELINFLYSIYSKALFTLQSTENDYKKITECSLKILKRVKLF